MDSTIEWSSYQAYNVIPSKLMVYDVGGCLYLSKWASVLACIVDAENILQNL